MTFTATISPNPGNLGTVTFRNNGVAIPGGSNIAVSGGVATFATSNLGVGSYSITAVYSGATNFSASTSSAVNQVVNSASSTALSSNSNPSNLGGSVTFIAIVSPNPGNLGTITFLDNGVAMPGASTAP